MRRQALAALGAAMLLGVSGSAAPDLAAEILKVHNAERAAVGVAPLRWDGALAAGAAVWAAHLAKLGRLEHSAPGERPGAGENLWMGTRGAFTLVEMAGGWASEKGTFHNGVFPDVARSGSWQSVGHYTQMIWSGTTAVGCAIASNAQADVLVCRYAPAGNMIGERVY